MATVPPSLPELELLDLLNIVPLEVVARILDCGDAWCRRGPQQRGAAMAPRLVCKAMRDLVDAQAVNVYMYLTQRRSGVLSRLRSCRSLHVSLLRYDPLHDFSPMMERLVGPPGSECLRHCEDLTLALRTDVCGALFFSYARKRTAVFEGIMATMRLVVALARACPNVRRLELHPCFHIAWPQDLDTQQAAAAYSSLGAAFPCLETLCVSCVACLVGVQALRGSGLAAIEVQQATSRHVTETMHMLTSQGKEGGREGGPVPVSLPGQDQIGSP